MKRIAISYGLIIVLITSCATFNISEIKNLEKSTFDSLCLIPDWETNNLRIDLIRQTYVEDVNDSTKETKETPYHPVGYNLGNGLFYDLNKNLSLRLDYLLNFSTDNNFEIRKINRPDKIKGATNYMFINDSLLVQYQSRKKIHYRYHRINNLDSTSFLYKKRLKYAIIETDSSVIYSGKKRKWDVIYKIDDSSYYLNNKRRKFFYQIKDNDIFLENDYVISLTNNDSKIQIKSNRKKREDIVIYTIEKDNDRLFIYNKNYSGLVIYKEEDSILIYRNKTFLRRYELLSGANK